MSTFYREATTQGVVEKREERRPRRNRDPRRDSLGMVNKRVSLVRTRQGFRTTPDARLSRRHRSHRDQVTATTTLGSPIGQDTPSAKRQILNKTARRTILGGAAEQGAAEASKEEGPQPSYNTNTDHPAQGTIKNRPGKTPKHLRRPGFPLAVGPPRTTFGLEELRMQADGIPPPGGRPPSPSTARRMTHPDLHYPGLPGATGLVQGQVTVTTTLQAFSVSVV